ADRLEETIGELRRSRDELAQALREATTDELTGLVNARALRRVLAAGQARHGRTGASFALVALDIDALERVNGVPGHPQGDAVLHAIGRTMRSLCRDVDTPARQGGEELSVVLPETDAEGAEQFAERLRA